MVSDLVERLRTEAHGQSTASRWLSEEKSKRQDDNPTGESLYAWLKPEETTAWQAADEITALRERVAALEAAANAFVAKLDECQPHIDDAFLHRSLRCGEYDGPQYGEELKALRALLANRGGANG